MNIGVDFGSTYSTISKYNEITDSAEAITLYEGAPASIPSVVSISSKGRVSCGAAAKDQMGKGSVRIFEAFKMLLNEPNREMLLRRGYDEAYSPRQITKYFLESTLKGALRRENRSDIQNLVICVPEIWGKNLNSLDGRAILMDILKNKVDLPIGSVRVVTEPEAASAFIARNYEKETEKSFNGYLLLIDYGGGTLDLTLTQVRSEGNGTMEIGYREGGGAGENHPNNRGDGAIGMAGIAYMQGVVELALREHGIIQASDSLDYTNPDFVAAVRDLESQMKAAERMLDIEDMFSEFGSYHNFCRILDEEPLDFHELEYDGEAIPVTYQHLYLAYRDIVESVLAQELSKINSLVATHINADPCTPAAGTNDDFKIAMVGGFSSFYLVKKQIYEIYNIDPNAVVDLRVKNVSASKQEQAISLGAALIAAGKVVLQKTARYSIGVYVENTRHLRYGIKYHQALEPGKPYFLCRDYNKPDTPANRVNYGAISGNIRSFFIEFTDRRNCGRPMNLKAEMLDRLRSLPPENFWNLGFSMDDKDIISFHIVPASIPGMPNHSKPIVIPLDSYSRMFDLTEADEVTV